MKTSTEIARIIVESGLEDQMDMIMEHCNCNLRDCDEYSMYELSKAIYQDSSKDEQEDYRCDCALDLDNPFSSHAAYIRALSSYIIECHEDQIVEAMSAIHYWQTEALKELSWEARA